MKQVETRCMSWPGGCHSTGTQVASLSYDQPRNLTVTNQWQQRLRSFNGLLTALVSTCVRLSAGYRNGSECMINGLMTRDHAIHTSGRNTNIVFTILYCTRSTINMINTIKNIIIQFTWAPERGPTIPDR